MEASPCAFCELPHGAELLRRDFELDICDACADGQAEHVLRQRGHTIVTREWQTRERSGDSTYTLYHYAVTARPPRTLAIRASFTRESTLDRLIKVFRRELQAGDPLFDDFIYISSRDRAQVTTLLDSTGAQATIMDLVSRFSGVFFDGGAFEVRDRSDAPLSPDAATMLVICAMSVHLERAAGGGGQS